MIQDGVDYGDGYEKAHKPGPGVEWHSGQNREGVEQWEPRSHPEYGFEPDLIYRQPIKPKDKSMSEQKIRTNAETAMCDSFVAYVTLSEAERLGEVAKKMREDMEIKAGDFVMVFDYIRKVKMVKDHICYSHNASASSYVQASLCAKITNPAHIQALTEIYEGVK